MIQGLLFDFFGTLVIYDEIKAYIKQSLTFKWCNFGTVTGAKAGYS